MKVSLIIPTYNAAAYLPILLKTLEAQSITFELIIIDSSSHDKTVEIAKSYTDRVISIPRTSFDHGGTRTQAAKMPSGEYLVFLTQDALPCDTDTIAKILEVFDSPQIGAVYGRQIPYENTNLFGKHLRMFNYGNTSYIRTFYDREKYGIKTAFLSDSFTAYRKSALQEIDYFKNGLIVGEDSYAGAKMLMAGYSLAYSAEAKVYHSHSYTIIEEFKRYFDIGVFHKHEHWILDTFGKAEGEGGRYMKSEFRYLLQQHVYFQIPVFFIRNAMKYLGYKLGYHYQRLPSFLIRRLSMHKLWWEKLL